MIKEEVVQDSDMAVTECTKLVSAAQPTVKPEKNTETPHNENSQHLTTPPQLLQIKPDFDTVVASPPKFNRFAALVPSIPPQLLRYYPYHPRQQPRRTMNFLSQMEAGSSVPIQVGRENPPTKAMLAEWASELQLGDGQRKPLDLKLKLRLF